jgi:hypothetical protein
VKAYPFAGTAARVRESMSHTGCRLVTRVRVESADPPMPL